MSSMTASTAAKKVSEARRPSSAALQRDGGGWASGWAATGARGSPAQLINKKWQESWGGGSSERPRGDACRPSRHGAGLPFRVQPK